MRRIPLTLVALLALVAPACSTVAPPKPGTAILAVAYSNVDGVDGYDPEVDVLISKLVDRNRDGIASKGDTLVNHHYPLDLDASSFGNFRATTQTVEWVTLYSNAVLVGLAKADGGDTLAQFERSEGSDLGGSESWFEFSHDESGSPGPASYIRDMHGRTNEWFGDAIQVESGSPSDPDTQASASKNPTVLGDDTFFDVEILVPLPPG